MNLLYKMFNHPIVNLYFFLSISLALVLAASFRDLLSYSILLLFIVVNNGQIFFDVIKKFLSTIFFLPFMLIFYVAISLSFTQMTFYEAMESAIFAFLKFSVIVLFMNFYLVTSSSEKLIISFRSLWLITTLRWKWVDDIFLFLSLALRLYPTFQSNWVNNMKSQKAVGIKFSKSYYRKLFNIAKELPSILAYQLNRSSDIALAMKLRGYGLQYPRNVIHPIPFTFINFIQIALITILSSYLIGLF